MHFFLSPSFSQSPAGYIFQKDDTILRKKYYDESIRKKTLAFQSIGKEYASDYKKVYDDQFKLIESFWKSGSVVTDPEVNGYLQKIVHKIITDNEELKNIDVRIVFSRDWWPNAYSMGDGSIAVNAGLFIFLNNEAELVFILCHELAHYYLEHTPKAIKKYVERVNSETFKAEIKRLSKEEYRVNQQLEQLIKSIVFDIRRHGRDKETEADKIAFEFMKNTGYDPAAIRTTLELLDKVDDSLFYKQPVELNKIFNFSEYPFKTKWLQKESSIFSQLKDDDSPLSKKEKDSLKTHPDCSVRIQQLAEILKDQNGNLFIVDEKLFNQLKKNFYLEMMEYCYRNDNLSRNLFYSLLLLENEPENEVAVYSVARGLNHLYEAQKDHKVGFIVDRESKIYPAQYNLLLRMLDRLRLDEIIALNTNFFKKYYSVMKDHAGFKKEMERLRNFGK